MFWFVPSEDVEQNFYPLAMAKNNDLPGWIGQLVLSHFLNFSTFLIESCEPAKS
jgi:hypothetical protein